MLEDVSLEPQPTEEELAEAAAAEAAAEQDAELARRIRREVRRMQTGDAIADIAQDEADEAEERATAEAAEEQKKGEEERQRKRQSNIFWQMISGTILLREGVSKYYSQMILVASLFFISIFVMFWSLHLDMRYSELARRVQLTRERSVRLQEMKYLKCSHSAISEELKRRGIELDDPTRPSTIIKEKK